MKLDPSVSAVVTGAASGLGEATARELASQGVKVAIFDMNAEGGEKVAGEIGGVFCQVDVTNEDSVVAGFAKARGAHGQERILVNCAGIAIGAKTVSRDRETGAIRHHALEKFAKVIDINLVGTFRCIAHSAAGMVTADPMAPDGERGLIVSTASVAATDGQIGQAAYSASKGGVLGMTLPIARDLSAEGIRANVIMPGIMETPMMAGMPDNVRQSLAQQVPFPKKLGLPSDYASLVRHMCENSYINGSAVRLDGAIRMGPR